MACAAGTTETRRRVSITFFYIFLGFLMGNWVSRIPDIKTENELSDGMLGVCLSCGAVGAMAALPFVNSISACMGSRNTCLLGSIWCCAVFPSVAGWRGLQYLVPAIFLFGTGLATIDVAVNVQAVNFEKYQSASALGQFLAFNNIGAVLGSLLGGFVASSGVTMFIHFVAVGIACIPCCVLFSSFLFNKNEEVDITNDSQSEQLLQIDFSEKNSDGSSRSVCNTAMIYLCTVGLLATAGEGGLTDWTTLYFQDNLNQGPMIASVAFSVFSGSLALGRFCCDFLTMRYNRALIVRLAGIFSGGGLALAVVSVSLHTVAVPMAIFSLAITGLSISVISPIVTSSAGTVPGLSPQKGISVVSGVTYFAFLVGPPLFGGVSYILGGLRWTFFIMACMLGSIAIIPGKLPHHSIYDLFQGGEKAADKLWPGSPDRAENFHSDLYVLDNTSSTSDAVLHQAIFDTDAIVVRDSLLVM